MSTKSTIAHGPNFHLYNEALDESNVYLEVEETQFEAGYNRVMVPIPVHIWEVIRQYAGIDLSYADKTDEELRQYVEEEVDKRIKNYGEAGEKVRGLISLSGAIAFGAADEPKAQQVAQGIAYFTQVREHQAQVKQAIHELEQMNRRK